MKIKIDNLKQKISRLDKLSIVIVYILCIISTVFVYSASRSMYYVKQNLLWVAIGTIILVLGIFIDYRISKKYIWYIYGFSFIILLMVKFFGKKTLGAQRWISIAGIQLQPSEFVKIVVIMVISYILVTKFRKGVNNIFDIVKCILYVSPLMFLILDQPDLGTTMILCFSYFCILFLNDANIKPIIYIVLFAMISAYPVYKYVLDDYQKTRIEVFLNPEKDIKNKGWHVTQSKISIGSGGFSGAGIFEGSQSRLKFLPEPQTDFIFSVIAEETGFVGATVILLLYLTLLLNFLKISKLVEDDYGRIIIYGVCGIFLGHVIINIGMTIGLVPVTGKTLLFLSYGGSSFLSSFMMISLVESIRIYSD